MTVYIIKRLLWIVPTLLAILALLFSFTYLIPGEPAEIILGPRATPELIDSLNERLGLDEPWHIGYVEYLFKVFRGDFGEEIFRDRPVIELIAYNLPHTLILTISSIGISVILGLLLGLIAVNFENNILDRIISIFALIFASVPSFVAASLFLLIFSVALNIFPSMGIGDGSFGSYVLHLVGPTIALSLSWIGYLTRLVRSSMLETLNLDFIITSKSFGIPYYYVLYKYALKKAIKPVVAVVGLGTGRLLGGAIFVEVIFNRPGLGKLLVDSIFERNFPVMRTGVLITALLFIIANLLADISYVYFDPRIKQE